MLFWLFSLALLSAAVHYTVSISKICAAIFSLGTLSNHPIDLFAILRESLDRALFLYIFIRGARSRGVRTSASIMHIRKFYKMYQDIVRF